MAIIITSSFFADIIFAQTDSKIETIKYHGIRPDDPGGRNGLLNPERGFHYGSYIGHPPGERNVWGIGNYLKGKATNGYSDDCYLMHTRRYEAHGITLLQTSCSLTDFNDKPISDKKLNLLQRSLNRCREAGIKSLLRFVYEKNMSRQKGPTVETILGHIDQLAPIIKNNIDIIYVFQAGFVGAAGEWHSSANYIEENHSQLAAIIAKEHEAIPKNRMIQLRVMPKYKRWILSQSILDGFQIVNAQNAFSGIPASRIGFQNDGFFAGISDGGTWTEPPFYRNPGNPEFDYMTTESAYVSVDGELYWADQGIKNKKGIDDGLQAAIRMRLHHYSTFSLEHSYSGSEGKLLTIDRWMQTPITLNQVQQAKLPLSNDYFQNTFGDDIARTQFEYITDHLGYRLELQKAVFCNTIKNNQNLSVNVDLINRGFATLINPRPVYFVLINISGELVLRQKSDANPQTWQPFEPGDLEYKPLTHSIKKNLLLKGLKSGEYMIGLWMPDAAESIQSDSRYAIRVANRDVPWWTTADGKFGVNVLGTVTITKQ